MKLLFFVFGWIEINACISFDAKFYIWHEYTGGFITLFLNFVWIPINNQKYSWKKSKKQRKPWCFSLSQKFLRQRFNQRFESKVSCLNLRRRCDADVPLALLESYFIPEKRPYLNLCIYCRIEHIKKVLNYAWFLFKTFRWNKNYKS